MRILLVSTYELGHQPLHVASPAAALANAGHDVDVLDISVQDWDVDLVDRADAVAFSVPMHTATRLALHGAAMIRERRPGVPICFYGLYAGTGADVVDRVIAGEYEPGLVAWASGASPNGAVSLGRQRAHLPVRSGLPPLERYARLVHSGEEQVVGYVEASHGCAHRCRHCPVPVVYDGRTRRVPVDAVVEDVAQLVTAGATHIDIGDPDFLNRWAHSMQVVSALHERFPSLTYSATTKVEHLLKHRDLIPQLAETGCVFVVSAFECVNDEILRYLDKGHTRADAGLAIALLREHGIEPRPSWLPFLPWTTVEDVADICDFIIEHDLVPNTDPIQLSIRLLIPQGSLMLEVPQMQEYLGSYDAGSLSYEWTPADPRTIGLQQRLAQIASSESQVLQQMFDAVYDAAGRPRITVDPDGRDVPRLTEPWFCCAEPTEQQFKEVTV